MADSVVSLGLDLSAFEAVLKQGFDGLGKGAQKALAEAKTAAANAAREATATFREQQKAQAVAAREASRAIREQEAASKSAAAAAERAAAEAAKAAADARKQTEEGLKGLGELLGLPVDKVEKLGQAFGLVGGPVAALAGGAAIAAASVAAVTAAAFGLVSAAIDLEKELGPLREDGLLPPLDPAFSADLLAAEQAMAGAKAASQDLVVQLGGALAPAVEWVAVSVAGMVSSIRASGLTLSDFGAAIRGGVVVVLQSLVDWALMIPTIYARMAGLVGSALESLGFESLGGKIKQVTDDALDFKNRIGEMVGGGVVDMWAEGVTLMGRDADIAGASVRRLGAGVLALGDAAGGADKAAAATKAAAVEAEKAAKAAAQWAREQGMVNAAAEDLARLGPELETLIATLERVAETQAAERWAAAEQGVADYGEAVREMVLAPLRDAAAGVKGLGSDLASAAGIDPSAGVAGNLLGMATEAVSAQKAAAEGVAQARADLAAAVATGDQSAIADARDGLRAAKAELEAADPRAFVEGLLAGATDMVGAIVSAIPGVVDGLLAAAPALISGIIRGIPDLINGIILAAPQIAIDLATALALELPIQLIANLPAMIKALGEGFIGGFVSAASRIKRVIGDIFREIATGGRADTKTFGDTPGPTRVGPQGARVSPGDYVVAARTREGLAAQIGGSRGGSPPEVRVVLDVRDGPVRLGLSRATTQTIQRAHVGRDTSGRRSPYG